MLSQLFKDMMASLDCEYQPVAMKFCFAAPEGYERAPEEQALCTFVKKAQVDNKAFYTDINNDNCMGKMMLGMIDIPPLEASGQAGFDFEVFRTPAANARLYHMLPRLVRGACNYVLFAPVASCEFDPDVVIVVANAAQTDVILRANAYRSGDLWESRDSHVAGCSWQFVYPYVSGKINHSTVGTHHGQKVRKPYPDGMEIISIPYQKFDEIALSMNEMPRQPISMRDEDQDELQRRIDHWAELSPDLVLKAK